MVAKLGEGVLRKGDRANGQTGGQMGGNSGLVGGAGIVLLLTSPHSPSFITVAHIEDTAKRYIEAICWVSLAPC